MKSLDFLTLGEILLRLSSTEDDRLSRGEVFKKHIGGAEFNVACGVSKLGLKAGMISKIPSHAIGTFARNNLLSQGLVSDYIIDDNSDTARMGIYFYEYGAHPRKPAVVYDRKNSSIYSLNIDEISDEVYSNTKLFHTSGITLGLGGHVQNTSIEIIKKFKAAGSLISFDVNFRGNLWNGDEARECIEKILPYVDIFFCSEDTARLTFKKTGTLKEIQKSFCSEYPIQVVASTQRSVVSPKVHNFTSTIYDSKMDTYYTEHPYENIDVVDRIGSGDAYVAGALYGYLKHGDCNSALAYGNAYSAVKNTIPGDQPASDLREINAIIKEHNNNSGIYLEMNR